jgi:predicted anti-sigma-YlaC factor YlaD
MVDCATYRPLIGSREGELSTHESAALAEHVAGCPGCRRWAASLAVTEGLVSEALLAAAARRDFTHFAGQVMARIEHRHLGPLARLRRTIVLHPWFALGGTLAPIAAALLVGLYVQRSAGSDVADSSLEVNSEGATIIIQSKDGPVVLIDDDDEES